MGILLSSYPGTNLGSDKVVVGPAIVLELDSVPEARTVAVGQLH